MEFIAAHLTQINCPSSNCNSCDLVRSVQKILDLFFVVGKKPKHLPFPGELSSKQQGVKRAILQVENSPNPSESLKNHINLLGYNACLCDIVWPNAQFYMLVFNSIQITTLMESQ